MIIKKLITHRFILSFLVLAHAAMIAAVANAVDLSEDIPEKWYQIELLIFANSNPAASEGERWPQQTGLRYPLNSLTLTPLAIDNTAEIDSNVGYDANIGIIGSAGTDNNEGVDNTSLNRSMQQSPLLAQANTEPEQPFQMLPDDQLLLAKAARKILSQRDFRPLFHSAWRQRIDSRKDATAIIVTGGDKFDNHYELEGTITLGLERYLHIETDLWLSSFSSKFGQTGLPTQVLPLRPNTVETEQDSKFAARAATPNIFSNNWQSSDSVLAIISGNYEVDQTIVFREKRRMRSNELHYIDHPLIGLLVRIIPYERPIAEPDANLDESDPQLSTEEPIAGTL